MSLFPAYTDTVPSPIEKIQNEDRATDESSTWLVNSNYTVKEDALKIVDITNTTDEEALPSTSNINNQREAASGSKKKQKKKHKRKSNRDEKGLSEVLPPDLDFYIDLRPFRTYFTVKTLKRPGCPRYRTSERYRFRNINYLPPPKYKRYFIAAKRLIVENKEPILDNPDIENENYLKHLKSNPKDVQEWLKYIEFKDVSMKFSLDLYQKEKQKLQIAEKAMRLNPESDKIQKTYLELLPKVHPTDEVLEIIQKMINKDPNNYIMWNALIYNKQSSMAQCIVPDVLGVYQKCMNALFSVVKIDEILVKIFKNCAIFIRQSGLWEQFFALIHLALSLNISGTAFNDSSKYYSKENNETLIEYEELILKSGLPLNEIWLRIEKLRSAYNFLPCIGTKVSSDPQRMVLNEDICHYIFPLMNQNYNFDLFILILKLLKYPFKSSLFENSSFFHQEIHEYDSIEDILTTFLELKRDSTMDMILFSIVKEMNIAPSYINSNIAYETYQNVLFEILLSGAMCFNTKQNQIVFMLYMQLERILIVLQKLSSKQELSKEFKKNVKSRIKKAIKNLNYQSNILVYNEYGLIEYEMDGFLVAESIFMQTIQQNFVDTNDFTNICLSYVEILLIEKHQEKALEILTGLALGKVSFEKEVTTIQSTKKLICLQKLNDLLDTLIDIELKTDNFDTEDYFVQNRLLLAIKTKFYYIAMVKSVTETVKELNLVIRKFPEMNQKHKFIRENNYQMVAFIVQNILSSSNKVLMDVIKQGLKEFPYNITLIKLFVTQISYSWMHIRLTMSKNLCTNSLIFMIAACRYRCALFHLQNKTHDPVGSLLISDIDVSEETYKTRILNILLDVTEKSSSIRQNALVWRFYLRALFDVNSNSTLVKCKSKLYEALDVCPWNKALYLDGAFFSPQELSSLMDLIIEKHLRIHAIPEELEILRSD